MYIPSFNMTISNGSLRRTGQKREKNNKELAKNIQNTGMMSSE